MKILDEFKAFIMRGNVLDLAVGVIIGAAFGSVTSSMVGDVLMPPIGKVVGNLDFSNLYISLSDKVDAQNAALLNQVATTQPSAGGMMGVFDAATRLPLADAKKLGPVIAYGNFLTQLINFIIVAFCVFMVVKAMNSMMKKFEKQKAVEAAAPAAPPADVVLLTEIRDLLQKK